VHIRILTEEMSEAALESGEVWFDFFDYLNWREKKNEGLGFWKKEKGREKRKRDLGSN